ncbi:kinase-like domain-containing protein [Armillaria luteobubalina]|uniref:non-specific serine/threonine protein kinase n=1 Tax=Armillaria luteobubalina TaxID=153913 RepID=A0AA39PDC8_9AGAR|nr:kinase-like domain-containing protein [Armillaria luteobubalina]KAK0500523.1 kinase-like domain-containing protein [Armillaria luteobubalina]
MPSEHPLPDFAGHLVANGRFLLLELLGAGSYGKVYRAVDTASLKHIEQHYAIKCMHRYREGSRRDTVQRREFSAHSKVSGHPNIITFHEIIYDRLYLYVVLDLCLGGDLYSAICESRLLHNNDVLIKCVFIKLIDALQYCHEQGVFHRDLKPENVVCSKGCTEVFLVDFGLATTFEDCEHSECGSGSYRSPECMDGGRKSPKYLARQSDVWALGIVLVNMLSNRFPWKAAKESDVLFNTFLRDSTFFQKSFPFSSGAIDILLRIFVIRPGERITLPKLREAILRLDTFFLSREDLFHAPKLVRELANWGQTGCDSSNRREKFDSTLPASNRSVNSHIPDHFLCNTHQSSRPRGLGRIILGHLRF